MLLYAPHFLYTTCVLRTEFYTVTYIVKLHNYGNFGIVISQTSYTRERLT